MTVQQTARQLAHEGHDFIGQKRKYSGEPYWVHTDEVSDIGRAALVAMARFTEQEIDEAAGGYELHDYLEDVVTELRKRIARGDKAAEAALEAFTLRFNALPALTRAVVLELTDVYVKEEYPDLNRAERKARENERIATISVFSKVGKQADLISNTKSIVEHDKDFAVTYLREKLAILPALSDGSPDLLQRCSAQVIAGFTTLGLPLPIFGAK